MAGLDIGGDRTIGTANIAQEKWAQRRCRVKCTAGLYGGVSEIYDHRDRLQRPSLV